MLSSLVSVVALLGLANATPVSHFGVMDVDQLFGRDSESCSNPKTSCQNTTAVSNLCCFNYPGGQFVQTQFWDSDPATGPTNSWTIHGLWPDHCDGTYDSNCDSSRDYTDIGTLISNAGDSALLSYMKTYWVSDDGTAESFWEHEWSKHGTCISTLDTKCYTDYTKGDEAVDFFNKVVQLFKTLPTYEWLEAAGITPSNSKTYTLSEIEAALKTGFGYVPYLGCDSDVLDEVWYAYNVKGSLQSGTFIPTTPVGSSSTCPDTGISYPVKSSGTAVPTTTTVGTATGTATSTKTGTKTTTTPGATGTSAPFSGTGYLEAYTSGSNEGCLISAGTWYVGGTCATYTASTSGSGFTLSSSKGDCGVSDGTFSCGSSVSSSTFTAIGGYLAASGNNVFYASAVPSGSTQEDVGTSSGSVEVQFEWTST